MNLPNAISLGRLLAVPVAIWLIMTGEFDAAFWLFVLAGVSDAVDGFIAKRFNAVSEVGRYLDPIADKALLVGTFVTLGAQGFIPVWLVLLVVSRDVLIVGGAILSVMLGRRDTIRPSMVSKANTAAQLGLAAMVLAKAALEVQLGPAIAIGVYVVAATTAVSGAGYLATWLRQVGRAPERP